MKKRMLMMLLALVMIVTVLPFAAMAAETPCDHLGNYGYYLETSQSTCKDQGAVHFFCNNCGINYWSQPKPLADHTYGAGSKCTVCGIVCSKHDYDSEVRVEPTCTVAGSVTKSCKICGYKTTVKTLKAPGHKFTEPVDGLVATCTVDGYTPHKKCSECGEKNSEYAVIEAKGHEIETIQDVAATCSKNGVLEQACKNCQYTNTETRKKTGHSYMDIDAKDPTCTEKGHDAYKLCTKCDKKSGYTEIATISHSYVNGMCACGAAAPNYSGPTKPNNKCTHASVSTYTTTPSCTAVGYTVETCDDCHVEMSRDIIPATDHTEKTTSQEPTCTEDGFVKVICKVCKTQLSYTVLNHFGHSYESGICTRCGGANSSKYTTDLQDYFIVG